MPLHWLESHDTHLYVTSDTLHRPARDTTEASKRDEEGLRKGAHVARPMKFGPRLRERTTVHQL